MSKQSKCIHRGDYSAPHWCIPTVALDFDILTDRVVVAADLHVVRADDAPDTAPLILDGKELTLRAVLVDGRALAPSEYEVEGGRFILHRPPGPEFVLHTEVEIDPYHNTSLEGLYLSTGILCSQNEAEGFRRITYFVDRPDILSVYTTTITANRKHFPCLLSNGNLQSSSDLPDGRQRVVWHDPFPKPCYLFALVAGGLGMIRDTFTTESNRDVELRIYVDPGNEERAWHAMRSLQKSMRWDEQRFGLEYDLDLYMIVAVDAFNAGAMENKGLNIFNSVYVLASPETATDADFLNVERVIAHEYFHNWTGNRVTLRDWFQLTLKEG
ncbi:MAG: aminopeptidase N, partial [Lentisphaeria bacterium]|nr:aminopeptidase N [Lentisphaeria bacterium]